MDAMGDASDVLVIGAGMAGLMAAAALQQAGRRVTILDKGRGMGGRMATRRFDGATCDHGAPCLSMTDPALVEALAGSRARGALVAWAGAGDPCSANGHAWRGHPGMSGLAKDLATGLDVRLETLVTRIARDASGWRVSTEAGAVFAATSMILTIPVPQALALMASSGVELEPVVLDRLRRVEYGRCLTVMAVLDGPSRVPAPGSVAPGNGPVARVTDNHQKGISSVPAVTIHGSHAFSVEHWDRDRMASGRRLLEAAAPWLGSRVTSFQVHGWRFSQPLAADPERFAMGVESPALLLAGDGFGEGGVQGAALSGMAAAKSLLSARGA